MFMNCSGEGLKRFRFQSGRSAFFSIVGIPKVPVHCSRERRAHAHGRLGVPLHQLHVRPAPLLRPAPPRPALFPAPAPPQNLPALHLPRCTPASPTQHLTLASITHSHLQLSEPRYTPISSSQTLFTKTVSSVPLPVLCNPKAVYDTPVHVLA